MTSNALYYPYIHVPESPWFTRVLLYWDQVGAIVPQEYLEDPDRLGSYMVSLVRESLVTQVVPGNYLWRVKNFTGAFLDFIDAKYGEKGEPFHSDWATVHTEKLGGASVHIEKLHDLVDKLCERGLAIRDSNNKHSPWLRIEPRTAGDFMAYLAGVLGQMTGDETFYPITNREDELSPFLGHAENEHGDCKLKIRQLLLSGILPAPSRQLEASQLLDFKERYKEELRRFRTQVEDRVSELTVIEDEELQKMRLKDITANFQETIDEIAARMKEQSNWPRLDFGTLCVVVGSGISAQNWKIGVTGAILSLAPAVYNAFRGSNIDLHDKPLAYAALARDQLNMASNQLGRES